MWYLGFLLALGTSAHAQHEGHSAETVESLDKPVVFLDKNPRIVAYQLGRLSNLQLLKVERNSSDVKYAPVYEAIAARVDMDAKYRKESIDALAKLRHTDAATELIGEIKTLEGEAASAAVLSLGRDLVARDSSELSQHQGQLEDLSVGGATIAQRSAALAALSSIESADTLWQFATAKGQIPALLTGLTLQPDASRRVAYSPRIEPLLQPGGDPDTLRGAIAAAATFPGHEAVVFKAFGQLLSANAEAVAVVQAVEAIPRGKWPEDQLGFLAEALLVYAGKVPESQRTETAYLDAMQLGNELAAKLPRDQGARLRKSLAGLGVNLIRLRTLREQMYFDKTLLVAEAGKPMAIVYENADSMPHNLVIVAPGTLDQVGTAAERMPPTPDSQGRMYVPDTPNVLCATKLLNPGEKAELHFNAPAKPDRYPYVCTFPGHWQRMRGVLVVVENLEEYLAKAPPEAAAPVVTAWTLGDFAEPLAKPLSARDPLRGKEVFTSAGCIACHQVGELGAVYGPNLTKVFDKYHQDPMAVLAEVLEPSKTIEPRYRSYNFKQSDGDTLTGFILSEDADSITVQTGASAALIHTYSKKELTDREPQENSVMPGGLLGLLNKDQVLDLLAFLQAASVAPAP